MLFFFSPRLFRRSFAARSLSVSSVFPETRYASSKVALADCQLLGMDERKVTVLTSGREVRNKLVVREMRKMGWDVFPRFRTNHSELKWDIGMVDVDLYANKMPQFVDNIFPWQRFSHMPGVRYMTQKHCLMQSLHMMKGHLPGDYDFFPDTYVYPDHHRFLQRDFRDGSTWIAKPIANSCGRGIFLANSLKDLENKNRDLIVQKYLEDPLLLNGFKMDIRLYALVTSVNPLRLYLFHDGLVRVSSVPYEYPTEGNMDDMLKHLTNYSIHKSSSTYRIPVDSDGTDSSKRRWQELLREFEREGRNVENLKKDISDAIVKTVLAVQPRMKLAYNQIFGEIDRSGSMAFHLLGFDIMLDKQLKPWVIEVNRSPSLAVGSQVDIAVKRPLVSSMLGLAQPPPDLEHFISETTNDLEGNRAIRSFCHAYERSHCSNNGWSQIYPANDTASSKRYFNIQKEAVRGWNNSIIRG